MLIPGDSNDPEQVDPGEDGENELIERVAPGKISQKEDLREYTGPNGCSMYDIAKKRFNIDKERETAKLR